MKKEFIIISVIGLVDLISTVYLIESGKAVEGNPWIWSLANNPIAMFILIKSIFLFVPLIVLSLIYKYNKRFVLFSARFCIIAYLVMYIFGSYFINHNVIINRPIRSPFFPQSK